MRPHIAATVAAGCLALIGAGTAQAAFPGKPGRLAFMQGDVGAVAPYGIATANLNGSAQALIEGPTCQEGENDPCPANATWSADGQRLAFERGGAITIVAPDGTGATTLSIPSLLSEARPAFGPSGKDIAFEGVGVDGKRDIYVRTFATGALKRLTFAGGAQPAWSASNRIAFTRAGNIYVINADGSAKKKITSKGGSQADWSPDSKRLAFVRAGNTYRVDRTGKNLKKLTTKKGYEPSWEVTGTRLLFHRQDSAGNNTILSVKLDGTGTHLQVHGDEGRRYNVFSTNQQPLP